MTSKRFCGKPCLYKEILSDKEVIVTGIDPRGFGTVFVPFNWVVAPKKEKDFLDEVFGISKGEKVFFSRNKNNKGLLAVVYSKHGLIFNLFEFVDGKKTSLGMVEWVPDFQGRDL